MSVDVIARSGLALGGNGEDNGDVNAQSDTNVVGNQAPVTRTDAGPGGVPMTDESGVMLPGSREEMRFLRKNSNWVNMIIAILACLAVVAVVLLMAPQPEVDSKRVVDYQTIAEQSQDSADFDLVVPEIPSGWTSNEASLDRMGDSDYVSWYVSFVGTDRQWISIDQAKATENWAENQVDDAVAAETVTVGGSDFQIYRTEDAKEYWVTGKGDTFVVITAIATPETIDSFAQQVAEQL
ncbi:Protein of unknown function [Brevibacterium sandarakinum]|uniref:DUF4245 domain-containing protein n=1 Tax=Brevibacterium sandarakinum TaxID=629680 RepID=A0A1H1LHA8_BRESA|nr:Protein of unknown function [Brevibacterium sandarakinum]